MKRNFMLILFSSSLLLMSGCESAAPVVIELNFPSVSTFLYSEFARIQAFNLNEEEIGDCPNLIGRARGGTAAVVDAYLDSGSLPICYFRLQGVTFEHIDQGPKAYVALVWDASEPKALLLIGCTVGEAYENAPPIKITLHMSDDYISAVERINDGQGPLYVGERQKCEGD